MFIWKLSAILDNLHEHMPDTFAGLEKIRASIGTEDEVSVLEREFNRIKSESIDYGVLEKANNIYSLTGSFGWDDVGSWLAIERFRERNEFNNVISGNVITVDTKNTLIQGENKLIAAVGLEDLIIIDTKDALLVCDKNSTGDIKKVLETLRMCNRTEYL